MRLLRKAMEKERVTKNNPREHHHIKMIKKGIRGEPKRLS